MKDERTILDSLLSEEAKGSRYEQENEILAPLLPEIELIEDQHIKYFVRSVLVKADTFWVIPGSFSGKHHPPDERGPGGNVLHTKRVTRLAAMIADAYGNALATLIEYRQDLVKDMVIAAALLHDVTKGVVWQDGMEPMYDKFHPYTVDEFIRDNVRHKDILAGDNESSIFYLDEDIQEFIMSMIRSHLGKWSPIPETFPATIPAMVVHLADKIASSLHEVIDGEDVVDQRWLLDMD